MTDHDASKAEAAYFLWLARGSPEGSSEIDWYDAEGQWRDRQVFASITDDDPSANQHERAPVMEIIGDNLEERPSQQLEENLTAGV